MGLKFRRSKDEEPEDSSTDRLSSITPGVPGRCPVCDGFGYIDHADLVYRSQVQHCRTCGHRWEYTFDEEGALVEVLDLRDAGEQPTKVSLIDLRGTDGGDRGDGRGRGDVVDDGLHEKSAGEWLRGTVDT